MRSIKVALVLLSSVAIAVSADHKAYVKHKNMLKKFPCAEPKPWVLELEDVMDKKVLEDLTHRGLRKSIKPAVTVVQRCNSTGCCENPEQRCSPIDHEEIKLTFAIFGKTVQYQEETVINHTECGCM